MAFEVDDIKPFVRLSSALVGLALLALSCVGFHHLSKTSGALEGQASFGCMCFLGLLFGLLLFFGESKSELFFFFFGFMRYRIGRAMVFCIAGIMTAIIGKNMNDACRCQSFFLLILEGIACLVCAVMQIIGVFTFGNNTSAMSSKTARRAAPPGSASASSPPVSPQCHSSGAEGSYVPPTPNKPPPPKKATPASSPPPPSRDDDYNQPSWMRV